VDRSTVSGETLVLQDLGVLLWEVENLISVVEMMNFCRFSFRQGNNSVDCGQRHVLCTCQLMNHPDSLPQL
jgi:hypothetical protein